MIFVPDVFITIVTLYSDMGLRGVLKPGIHNSTVTRSTWTSSVARRAVAYSICQEPSGVLSAGTHTSLGSESTGSLVFSSEI